MFSSLDQIWFWLALLMRSKGMFWSNVVRVHNFTFYLKYSDQRRFGFNIWQNLCGNNLIKQTFFIWFFHQSLFEKANGRADGLFFSNLWFKSVLRLHVKSMNEIWTKRTFVRWGVGRFRRRNLQFVNIDFRLRTATTKVCGHGIIVWSWDPRRSATAATGIIGNFQNRWEFRWHVGMTRIHSWRGRWHQWRISYDSWDNLSF